MAQGRTIPIGTGDSGKVENVIVAIRFQQPKRQAPAIVVVATDAASNVMAEVVGPNILPGGLAGYVVRLRAQGCVIPRFRDSESFYPTFEAAEDAYWRDCDARRFHEDDVIEWGHWQEAVAIAAE